MMPTAIHAFSQEEIMAYLDGELPAHRALAVAKHVDGCRECQAFAAEMRSVSQQVADWAIEPPMSALPRITTPAGRKRHLASLHWMRHSMWIAAAPAAVIVMVVWVGGRPSERVLYDRAYQPAFSAQEQRGIRALKQERAAPSGAVGGVMGGVVGGTGAAPAPPPIQQGAGPLIVRTAQLSVVSENFEQSRAEMERITKLHAGYLEQLQLTTPDGAGRSLNATLRIPAAQLDPVLQELKRLGKVRGESQQAEDVTQHAVDVNARLSNLRTTEDRLLNILRERTGKLADVLQVEEAVDRTRGDIEAAEAEQKVLSGQIAFATVQVTVAEEYKAPLAGNDNPAMTKLRNAAVNGFLMAFEGIIGVLAFLMSALPGLAIVAAIGFYPVRWYLRKWRADRRRFTGG